QRCSGRGLDGARGANAAHRAWPGDLPIGPAVAGGARRLTEGRSGKMVAPHQGGRHRARMIRRGRNLAQSSATLLELSNSVAIKFQIAHIWKTIANCADGIDCASLYIHSTG